MMPHGKWDSITVKRQTKQRIRDTVPKARSDDMRLDKIMDQNLSYRRWLKSLRDQHGSIQMIFGVVLSLGVLFMTSLIWLTMNNPVHEIINQSRIAINTSAWNATLTTTDLQWSYFPWFAVILFLVMIFMGAYWYSKGDRPVERGYYR